MRKECDARPGCGNLLGKKMARHMLDVPTFFFHDSFIEFFSGSYKKKEIHTYFTVGKIRHLFLFAFLATVCNET